MTPDPELPRHRASNRKLVFVFALGVALAATACGDETDPSDGWEPIWRNTIATARQASTPDLASEQCQNLLGYLRVQRTVLTPVPLEDLEEPVDRWFTEAEGVFFECELGGDAAQDSLLTLEAIEAEVDAVLEVEQ